MTMNVVLILKKNEIDRLYNANAKGEKGLKSVLKPISQKKNIVSDSTLKTHANNVKHHIGKLRDLSICKRDGGNGQPSN